MIEVPPVACRAPGAAGQGREAGGGEEEGGAGSVPAGGREDGGHHSQGGAGAADYGPDQEPGATSESWSFNMQKHTFSSSSCHASGFYLGFFFAQSFFSIQGNDSCLTSWPSLT